MRIVIAGGSGFLGSPLAETWAEDGHDVRVLTRALAPGASRHESGTGVPGITAMGWRPDGRSSGLAAAIDGADAVINLAGASVAGGRWTPQRKAELRDSRLLATRSLASAITDASVPPSVFVSSSAVGYYGPATDDLKTEASAPGQDFLATLCEDWEREAMHASRDQVRIALIRTGTVLERSGGALQTMIAPFKFFAGGPIGSGRQYMSWIHRLDWIEMVRWIVQTPAASGPINLTAPHPVTNRQFAQALGQAMKRPSALPVPGFALRLALGEFANVVLTGQRAIPSRALSLGYHFRYPEIEIALRGIFAT